MTKTDPYWAALLPLAALAAAGLRWLLQGSGNVFTDMNRRFYVPDEAIGWASSETGALWLGLDSLGVIAVGFGSVALGAWLVRRREVKRGETWTGARYALWPAAVIALVLPAWAFTSGGRPDGGRDFLPAGLVVAPSEGIRGSIQGAPRGTYRVLADGNSVVAVRLHASGEEFEARFSGGITGWWRGDPSDLRQPMTAEVEVSAGSVDTGISKRSKHATEFLEVNEHPKLRFTLDRLTAAEPDGKTRIRFAAEGTIELMGARVPVKITGLMWSPQGRARTRLGVTRPVLVISAGFSFDLSDTPLRKDMDSFDRATAPVAITLVLALDEGAKGDES